MENINWEFLIQIGIFISLVFLIFKIYDLAVMIESHFEQDHEMQRKHAEYLANVPTYSMLYSLKKGEPFYDD